jgi:DNA replication protein DnaC
MSVLHERLIELCNELRLGGIAAQYPALAQTAAERRASFTDFLEELLVAERESRRARAREMFARVAGFPAIKTLDQYGFGFATGPEGPRNTTFSALDEREAGQFHDLLARRARARLTSRSRSAISPPRGATRRASSVRPIWC